jgi:hypothetical protein
LKEALDWSNGVTEYWKEGAKIVKVCGGNFKLWPLRNKQNILLYKLLSDLPACRQEGVSSSGASERKNIKDLSLTEGAKCTERDMFEENREETDSP